MNVLIISFSARSGGNCDGISRIVAGCCQNSTIFRFSEHQVHPCGGCRYECFGREAACPYLGDPEYELLDAICRSDLVYFVIPNYCDYPCSNYFMFNERSQCYFQGKPEQLEVFLRVPKKFIVISNTNQNHFRQILAQNTETDPEILFLSAKMYGKVSISGDLTTSEAAIADIQRFVKGQYC